MPRGNVRESNLGAVEKAKLNLVSAHANIINVANGEVGFMVSVPTTIKITELHASVGSGSVDIVLKRNGASLLSTANSVTTAGVTDIFNETLNHNDALSIELSNNAAAVNLSISLLGEII